jgi:TonB family protein
MSESMHCLGPRITQSRKDAKGGGGITQGRDAAKGLEECRLALCGFAALHAGLILLVLLSPASAQDDLLKLGKSHLPSVVSVISYDKNDNVMTKGTGFFVTKYGDLLTRRRVLPTGAARAEIRTHDGKVYPVTDIIHRYEDIDLIRVWVGISPGSAKPLRLTAAPVTVGERVMALSYDLSSNPVFTEGIVSAVSPGTERAAGKTIHINGTLPLGSSGAPVLNADGELAGMALVIGANETNFGVDAVDKIVELVDGLDERNAHSPSLLETKATRRVMAEYPVYARTARISGAVVVEVVVDTNGNVIHARAVSGPSELRDPAVEAARKWKFTQVLLDGKPVEGIATITFTFAR